MNRVYFKCEGHIKFECTNLTNVPVVGDLVKSEDHTYKVIERFFDFNSGLIYVNIIPHV